MQCSSIFESLLDFLKKLAPKRNIKSKQQFALNGLSPQKLLSGRACTKIELINSNVETEKFGHYLSNVIIVTEIEISNQHTFLGTMFSTIYVVVFIIEFTR